MNLSDLKSGDRFIVAGIDDVFTCVGPRKAVSDNGDITLWTYDAECDLYDTPS